MANQTSTADILTQSIADGVAERLGLSSAKVSQGLASLVDIKKLLGKMIDPSKTVQSDQKFPFVFSKTFKDVLTALKEDKKEAPVSKLEKKEDKKEDFHLNLEKKEDKKETSVSKLEKKEEPKPILFAGFTPEGLSIVEKVLPPLISGLIDKANKDKTTKDSKGGISDLSMLAGLAGLVTLAYGLQTEGPFKGLAKLASKGLLSVSGFTKVINNVARKLIDGLIDLPKKLLKSFTRSIGAIFGKGAALKTFKTGLGALKGFVPKMLKGALLVLKKVPFVGGLISLGFAVSRFKSGDYVGGGLEILSGIAQTFGLAPLSWAIDGLNAVLDIKAGGATGKQTQAKLDILKGMGDWIAEKIIKLPMIGPLIKAVKHLANREWKKGLKQLAYALPVVDAVAAFLGDEEASDTAKGIAGAVKGVNWSEIGSWLFSTFKNVPIIGPLMKAMEHFQSKDYLKGLKQLAYIAPVFEIIGSLLGDSETGTVSAAIGDWGKDLVTDLSKWIVDSLTEMIDIGSIKDSILGAAATIWENRPKILGGKGSDIGTAQPDAAATPVGDAVIDPKGGLLVSSPTEGSLFQLSKNDGVVAAPFGSSADSGRSSDKTIENILGVIANNTGATNGNLTNLIAGFNNLAKELAKTGAVDNAPVVISNNADSSSSGFAGAAQYIKTASSSAREYTSYAGLMKPIAV
jgi:hypothetical protein